MSKRKQVTVPMEKIREQDKYIDKMRDWTYHFEMENGRKPRVHCVTFGHQMNNLHMK